MGGHSAHARGSPGGAQLLPQMMSVRCQGQPLVLSMNVTMMYALCYLRQYMLVVATYRGLNSQFWSKNIPNFDMRSDQDKFYIKIVEFKGIRTL
jgi:hypothetical protein